MVRVESRLPKKQRKARYQAKLHQQSKLVSAHLSASLRKKLKKRAIPVRSKDMVLVTRGKFRERTGKVTRVDHKKLRVFVDGLSRKKSGGKEVPLRVHPSNVEITELAERKTTARKSAA